MKDRNILVVLFTLCYFFIIFNAVARTPNIKYIILRVVDLSVGFFNASIIMIFIIPALLSKGKFDMKALRSDTFKFLIFLGAELWFMSLVTPFI